MVGIAAAVLLAAPPPPFVVEVWGGLGVPLTDFARPEGSASASLGGGEVRYDVRPKLGVAAGYRVWAPLQLDAGLWFGYGHQGGYSLGGTARDYDPALRFVEVAPWARGMLSPFGPSRWSITVDASVGWLVAFGGRRGATDFPRESQLLLRLRFGAGVAWRVGPASHLLVELASVTTDFPLTSEFSDIVGTQVAYEPRVALALRF